MQRSRSLSDDKETSKRVIQILGLFPSAQCKLNIIIFTIDKHLWWLFISCGSVGAYKVYIGSETFCTLCGSEVLRVVVDFVGSGVVTYFSSQNNIDKNHLKDWFKLMV